MTKRYYLGVWVLLLCLFPSCIKAEAPNAEADILSVSVQGIELLREPTITNTTVVFQVPAWENLTKVAPKFELTPGASIKPASGSPQDFTHPVTYTVTSEDKEWSKEYTVSFVSLSSLPSLFSFEQIRLHDGRYHVFQYGDPSDTSKEWASPNQGYVLSNPSATATEFPVHQAEGFKGKGARLETKSTGGMGTLMRMPIAAGSLFLGELDAQNIALNPQKSTQFGIPTTREPKMITGYYKYKPGKKFTDRRNREVPGRTDECDIYGVFYEVTDNLQALDGTNVLAHPNIVSIARLQKIEPASDWTPFKLRFRTKFGKRVNKAKLAKGQYNFTVVFSSSKDGAKFEGAVGSELFVDEVEVSFK